MTALSPETAIAIIASHGADPARWPAADRAAVLALSAADADVAAALADARILDAALGDWLAAPLPMMAAVDVAAITSGAPGRAAPMLRRIAGWRPALMAASFAAMLATAGWLAPAGLLPTPGSAPQMKIASAQSPSPSQVAGAGVGEADLAFAYVFTPTAAEEELI